MVAGLNPFEFRAVSNSEGSASQSLTGLNPFEFRAVSNSGSSAALVTELMVLIPLNSGQ